MQNSAIRVNSFLLTIGKYEYGNYLYSVNECNQFNAPMKRQPFMLWQQTSIQATFIADLSQLLFFRCRLTVAANHKRWQ